MLKRAMARAGRRRGRMTSSTLSARTVRERTGGTSTSTNSNSLHKGYRVRIIQAVRERTGGTSTSSNSLHMGYRAQI
jgi:hypothetical protein